MQILVLNNRVPWPLNDGGNLVTYSVAHQLQMRGHSVTMACLNTQKHFVPQSDLPPLGEWVTVEIDTSLTFMGLLSGFLSAFPYNVKRFWSKEMEEALTQLFRRKTFDLIQVEGSYMAMYVPLLRKLSKAPILLRSHNVEHEIWARTALVTKGLKGIYLRNLTPKIKRFEIETMQDFDGVIAISEKDQAWYAKQGYPKPLTTITAGVDLERFPFRGELGDPKSIGFIGSLEWIPNQQGLNWFVEKVWKPFAAKHPEARFHIAGKNPPADMTFEGVPGIVFHGMVPDAYAFMEQHGILVTPLLSGGGMRVKVVEGMAMGKCIVSTTIGAEGVEYEPGNDLYLADNPTEFLQVLENLWQNPAKVQSTGIAARNKAEQKYGWSSLMDRLEAFYEVVRNNSDRRI